MNERTTRVNFHRTPVFPCSYLADREARSLFADPRMQMSTGLYSALSNLGFRRSGDHVYRPDCESCRACVPLRVPVSTFRPSRQQKRTLRANSDTTTRLVRGLDRDEYFELYERYISARHGDGDMFPATRDQYRGFLQCAWGEVRAVEVRRDERLLAVGVVDVLHDGLSAVYSFFDPDEHKRSLGTLLVLRAIDIAARAHLTYVYLGYWIDASKKMNYKAQFVPHERLQEGRWQAVVG